MRLENRAQKPIICSPPFYSVCTPVFLQEMRDSLNNVRHEFSSAAQRMAQKPECPDKSCVSTTVLVGAVSVQFVLLICYFMYR